MPVYDASANIRSVKAQVFGPFDPLLAPIDRASRPSAVARPAPVLSIANAPELRAATGPRSTASWAPACP